jgi:hypothetical protein
MREPWSFRRFLCRILGHRPLPPNPGARLTFCKRCGHGVAASPSETPE